MTGRVKRFAVRGEGPSGQRGPVTLVFERNGDAWRITIADRDTWGAASATLTALELAELIDWAKPARGEGREGARGTTN